MCSWGKLETKDTKSPKTQQPLLKNLEQKHSVRSKSKLLNMLLSLITSTRVGKTPKAPPA